MTIYEITSSLYPPIHLECSTRRQAVAQAFSRGNKRSALPR